MMYELYAYPNTYALGTHILLEECNVPYRIIDVSQFTNQEQNNAADDFKRISPHQRVPALKLPDGTSLFESGAIALYLSDSLDGGKFSVDANSVQRPEYLQWLFYLSSTLQPEVMHQFHPEYFFNDLDTQNRFRIASMNRLDKIWTILEARYFSGPWMFENRPTAVDFSLMTVLLWDLCFRTTLSDYPNLNRTLAEIKSRDAYQKIIQWHQN